MCWLFEVFSPDSFEKFNSNNLLWLCSLASFSYKVLSDSVPIPEVDMFEAELLPVVTIELPDIDTQAFCRCFTELLGDMVFKPRNLIAYNTTST